MAVTLENIATLIGGAGALSGTAKYIYSSYRSKKLNKSIKAIENAAHIYDELNELMRRTQACRVLVMYTSNGGGVPDSKAALFFSILYEIHNAHLFNIRQDWQTQPLDNGYIQMLRSLIIDESWSGHPSTLEDGFLKELLGTENICNVHFVPICRTEKKFHYLSIQWDDPTEVPSEDAINTALQVARTKIAMLMGESSQIKV